MPNERGPWELNKVKARLRQEQVQREKAASERYRQKEAKAKEQIVGEARSSNCVLVVLLLCCFFFVIVVLALCTVVLSLTKRYNENR